ncbi:acyl-CoA dehydrogenase family protein [Limimaricola litoreus]|uniref:Acyl-CoA/acyl-ACP dehydrogenase n=1 Tax=Limimaricola litoreus TaxID=2955316 RepID=A0A9X2JND9_9RHOB|nr:acyl-CoA dehydrogenase family protein [Limimaricola litoreus]MCP1168253.1 acyl-CoA/acyl-ACP dehydrogenase [Limimaricola litoreus]
MTSTSHASNDHPLDRATRGRLSQAACEDFDQAVDLLRRAGLFGAMGWKASAQAMRQIASADLSLGRLFEGHVNARQLIETHADADLRAESLAGMEAGLLFGVWGADGAQPVTASGDRLSGAKRFASGLGHVDRAIVSARSDEGQRLFVVDASDTARHDPAAWTMSGMQDSRSGGFDCEGLRGRPLGPPGIYTREPHFLGGTWRIAAVTLGGTSGLLDRAAAVLRARGQEEAEAHLLRLGPVAGRVLSAWPAILRAGEIASGPEGAADPEAAAVRALSTRLLTEEIGQEAIAAVERSVGLSMFDAADPVGRMARDLACYMRQAARDAFSAKVASALLMGDRPFEDWFDG